jgi:predicted DNA-binding transcriptional regulator YafY
MRNVEGSAGPGNRWTQERRLEFIDYRLRWEGALNRGDLTTFFGISVPQASLDIARYTELAPDNLEYDRSARVYRATRGFKAFFGASSPERFLQDLLLHASSASPQASGFLGAVPSFAVVPSAGRAVNGRVVLAAVRALQQRSAIRVIYQSLTSEQPSTRTLSPHSLAHDGQRWHIRAFCHERGAYRDFLLARMLKVQGTAEQAADGADDEAWHTSVTLHIAPHPKLAPAHRRAIELDYGMEDGRVTLTCRQALLFYTLRNLHLDRVAASPEAQQIVLRNAREVRRFVQFGQLANASGVEE